MKTISVSSPQIKELIVKKIGKNLLWGLEKVIARYSLVPNTPFLSSEQFEWTQSLENNWQAIRNELDVILQYTEQIPRFQDISEDQARNVSKDDLWKTFFLYGYGVKMEQNCSYCRILLNISSREPNWRSPTCTEISLHPTSSNLSEPGRRFILVV